MSAWRTWPRSEECELVKQKRGKAWHVAFRTGAQPLAPEGIESRSADSLDRREALGNLLYAAEQRL